MSIISSGGSLCSGPIKIHKINVSASESIFDEKTKISSSPSSINYDHPELDVSGEVDSNSILNKYPIHDWCFSVNNLLKKI